MGSNQSDANQAEDDGKIRVYIYNDDSTATENEHAEMDGFDIEQRRGGVYAIKRMTRQQAEQIGVDLAWLD
jgi:hypothetical protein